MHHSRHPICLIMASVLDVFTTCSPSSAGYGFVDRYVTAGCISSCGWQHWLRITGLCSQSVGRQAVNYQHSSQRPERTAQCTFNLASRKDCHCLFSKTQCRSCVTVLQDPQKNAEWDDPEFPFKEPHSVRKAKRRRAKKNEMAAFCIRGQCPALTPANLANNTEHYSPVCVCVRAYKTMYLDSKTHKKNSFLVWCNPSDGRRLYKSFFSSSRSPGESLTSVKVY